jgi:biotin carboxyl carrier protein
MTFSDFTVVCVLEAMKLFTEVKARKSGEIVDSRETKERTDE